MFVTLESEKLTKESNWFSLGQASVCTPYENSETASLIVPIGSAYFISAGRQPVRITKDSRGAGIKKYPILCYLLNLYDVLPIISISPVPFNPSPLLCDGKPHQIPSFGFPQHGTYEHRLVSLWKGLLPEGLQLYSGLSLSCISFISLLHPPLPPSQFHLRGNYCIRHSPQLLYIL